MGLDRGMTFHIRERRPNGQLMGFSSMTAPVPNNRRRSSRKKAIIKSDEGTFLLLKNGTVQRRKRTSATRRS